MKKKNPLEWIIINLPELIAAAAFIVTVSSTGFNVFTRYVMSKTYFWYSDLNILMFSWMVFPGAAAAYKRKMHYGVEALVNKLGAKSRAVYDVSFRVLLLVIVTVFFVCGCQLCYKVEGLTFQALGDLSYAWAYLAMPFSFGLIIIYSVRFLLQDIKSMGKKLGKGAEVS